eukprot:2397361-Ditylum_brightwellii.AAC.1
MPVTNGKESLKWYARFCKSTSDLEKAKEYYLLASYYLSLFRLSCHKGDLQTGKNIVEESDDAAAISCYIL